MGTFILAIWMIASVYNLTHMPTTKPIFVSEMKVGDVKVMNEYDRLHISNGVEVRITEKEIEQGEYVTSITLVERIK